MLIQISFRDFGLFEIVMKEAGIDFEVYDEPETPDLSIFEEDDEPPYLHFS